MADTASLEAVVRSLGGVLQLGGVTTVAIGIRGTRKELKRPGVLEHVKRWMLRFRRRDAQVHAMSATITARASMTADGVVHRNWDALDADGRLDELRSRIERLEDKIAKNKVEIRRGLAELSEAMSRERAERVAAGRETAARVERLSGGNLRVEALGAVLFAIGIVLATWAPEIAHMFR